jgi:hypothetical protein
MEAWFMRSIHEAMKGREARQRRSFFSDSNQRLPGSGRSRANYGPNERQYPDSGEAPGILLLFDLVTQSSVTRDSAG